MTEIMTRLRDETAELHRQAESQDFQQRMFRGALERREYAAWLGQMWLVHRALEAELERVGAADPRFVAVRAEHFKADRLAADLAALGAREPAPLSATARLVARIVAAGRDEPLRLLGYQYVLEGSTNGNRILARRLLPVLGLDAGTAGRYLDPYGERQREVWAQFKADMGAVALDAAESDLLVEAARELFAAITELSAELGANAPVAQSAV
jgi:heme oxygenase